MLYGISQLLPVFHPFQQKVLTLLLLRWHSFIYLELSSPQQTTGQLLPVYTTSPRSKDFILYLEHWLVSTILEYCTAVHSVAPRDVPYLYELVPLPGKFQKSYRSGNNFAYKFWSPPFNIVINYLHRLVIYKYQRSGQLMNSNKYSNKYYSPYSAHTASRNIQSLWCWCLSSLHFTPILTPQPKASSIVMNLILS